MKKIIFLLLLLCSLLVSGCTDSSDISQKVEAGDYISVNYTGSLEDGTVFDSSTYHGPFNFTVGVGRAISGFDDAVIGMGVGESKTVTIPPEEGYGPYYPELVISVPVNIFESANVTPVIGMSVPAQNGQTGTIVNISGENVTIDYNHALAGKNLTFTIELVSIEKS